MSYVSPRPQCSPQLRLEEHRGSRRNKTYCFPCDQSLTISWLAAILPYTMSNINFLFSYPSDLYLKGYSENAAQVDYLSCSFRSVYWGLSRCVMRFWWDDTLTTFQLFKICDFYFRPRPHYPRGIWKRRFYSENASNVLGPHYTGWISKRNNPHQSPWDLCLSYTRAGKSCDHAW